MQSDPDENNEGSIVDDAPLLLACECGFREQYQHAAIAKEFIYFNHVIRKYTVECPECNRARPAQVLTGAFTGQVAAFVSAGRFTDDRSVGAEPLGEAHHWDTNSVDFESVPSPLDMAKGLDVVSCTECSHSLTEEDKRADPHAPEVGYEYYECPECDHKSRVDAAKVIDID